jgi:hypothetical protein
MQCPSAFITVSFYLKSSETPAVIGLLALSESGVAVTERLASRVKGLTGLFCVLLLTKTSPNPPPAGLSTGRRGCGKRSLVAATHEFFKG